MESVTLYSDIWNGGKNEIMGTVAIPMNTHAAGANGNQRPETYLMPI